MATRHQAHRGIGVPRQTRLKKGRIEARDQGRHPRINGGFSGNVGQGARQHPIWEWTIRLVNSRHLTHHATLGFVRTTMLFSLLLLACQSPRMVPAFATRAFPELPKSSSNSTIIVAAGDLIVQSDRDFPQGASVWLNERFVLDAGPLQANQPKRLNLRDFRDKFGERPVPDDFWRSDRVTRLVSGLLESDGTLWRAVVSVRD